jgi:hypothetical protein
VAFETKFVGAAMSYAGGFPLAEIFVKSRFQGSPVSYPPARLRPAPKG